jgi:SP family general alpha glucoside:H+ symporter-like MFS transporter
LGELHWLLLGSLLAPPILSYGKPDSDTFQGGICFCCIIYTYFRVPEPQGRSFAELDLLFERGISARKFASTDVDVFSENVDPSILHSYEEKLDLQHAERSVR